MTGCVKPKRRPPEAKRDRVDEGPFSRFVNAEAFMDPGFMESFARLHISARAKSRWRGETTVQLPDQQKSGGARGAAEDSSGADGGAALKVGGPMESRARRFESRQRRASVVSARTSANGLLHSRAWPEPTGQNGDTLLFGRVDRAPLIPRR